MFRNRKENPAGGVELPITPMLDMTFQLLAFFILTFHPGSIAEGQLDCGLPARPVPACPNGNVTAEPPVPVEPELALRTQLTVVLKAQRGGVNHGSLSAILVQMPEGEFAMNNVEQLRRFLNRRRDDGDLSLLDHIDVEAEAGLKYGYVIEAMDTCIRSGFPRLGLLAPVD